MNIMGSLACTSELNGWLVDSWKRVVIPRGQKPIIGRDLFPKDGFQLTQKQIKFFFAI